MTDKNETTDQLTTEPQTIRSPGYQVVFSNHSRMRVSQNEFAITFSYLENIPIPGSPINAGPKVNFAEDKATVVLTPHHAKTLALVLEGAIEAFEREYGRISLTSKAPIGVDKLTAAIMAKIAEAN